LAVLLRENLLVGMAETKRGLDELAEALEVGDDLVDVLRRPLSAAVLTRVQNLDWERLGSAHAWGYRFRGLPGGA
jgi:hypothetical protein